MKNVFSIEIHESFKGCTFAENVVLVFITCKLEIGRWLDCFSKIPKGLVDTFQ